MYVYVKEREREEKEKFSINDNFKRVVNLAEFFYSCNYWVYTDSFASFFSFYFILIHPLKLGSVAIPYASDIILSHSWAVSRP